MVVLQILPELNEGGVERGTIDVARALVERGHKAIIISNGGRLVKELQSENIKHYCLPVHEKSLFTIIRSIFKVSRILEQEKIDIIHVRSRVPAWVGYFAYRLYLARCARKKIFLTCVFLTTCHGYYRRHVLSKIMGWGKFVIVISSVIGKHMREHFSVPFYRLRLIPRGVDIDVFKYQEPRLDLKTGCNVGIVGRITPLKGHDVFLKAMARVVRTVPKVKIIIAGDTSRNKQTYKRELELLVRQLGLERYVEFLGHVEDIPELMHRLDLLVLATTTAEAFGRVLIEAGACGVPVVATEVGGVIDIIENRVNGMLVPPQDPQEMSSAIIELLKDRELARRVSLKARERIEEKFSLIRMVNETISVYEEAVKTLRILVIKYSALGDVILSIPSLKAIRRQYPSSRITVLTSRQSREIVASLPYIDDVIVFEKERFPHRSKLILETARLLRRNIFDLVIDLQNNKTSHILSYLSLCPRRIGYDNGKLGILMNYRIKDRTEKLTALQHQFRLLSLLGIRYQDEKLELSIREEDKEFVDDFLDEQWIPPSQVLIGLNLGASSRWLSKRWPLERFVYLAEELALHGIRVVVTGTEVDKEEVKRFLKMTKAKPVNACGRTNLTQLAALIKRCAVYVTADSAPLHIAMAVNTPVVALFGPTDYRRHIAYLQDSLIVINKDMVCAPCYRATCKDYECMRKITVQEVLDATLRLLKLRPSEKVYS
jgi:lipopolysaccharide heptosyltransferase II